MDNNKVDSVTKNALNYERIQQEYKKQYLMNNVEKEIIAENLVALVFELSRRGIKIKGNLDEKIELDFREYNHNIIRAWEGLV